MTNAKTVELVKKLAKGATASFSMKNVMDIAAEIPGWSFKKTTVIVKLDDYTRTAEEVVLPEDGGRTGARIRRDYQNDAKGLIVVGEERTSVETAHVMATAAAKKPGKKIIVSQVGALQNRAWDKITEYFFTLVIEQVCEAYTITAPNGATTTIHKEPRYVGISVSDVLRFMNAQGFMEQAMAAAQVEKHIPAKARALDNTGTCPICFRNIKLNDGKKTVNHGYTQDFGRGQHRGDDCSASQTFLPYELSSKGTEFALRATVNHLRSLDAALKEMRQDVKDGAVITETSWNDKVKEVVAEERHVKEIASKIAQVEGVRDFYAEMVKIWELRALPKEGEVLAEYVKT